MRKLFITCALSAAICIGRAFARPDGCPSIVCPSGFGFTSVTPIQFVAGPSCGNGFSEFESPLWLPYFDPCSGSDEKGTFTGGACTYAP